MARLKFGSGIKFEAQLPQLDPIPKIGPGLLESPETVKSYDEDIKNLELLIKTLDSKLNTNLLWLADKRTELEKKVEELAINIDEVKYDTAIIIPEVKTTYVQANDKMMDTINDELNIMTTKFHKVNEELTASECKYKNLVEKQKQDRIVIGLCILTILLSFIF